MDLRSYLKKLAELGELKKIAAPVSTSLELAALCRREFANQNGGQALLFSQVEDSDIPVVANLFGSKQRTAQMLHCDSLRMFSQKVHDFVQGRTGSVKDRFRLSENLASAEQPGLQNFYDFDLNRLPAIQSWPAETGRYLTLALAITRHPQTRATNLGLYRAQIFSANSLAVNFAPGSGASEHLEAARRCNQSLPISLVLGADPALFWVAAAPLPKDCSELAFYRALLNPTFRLTDCVSQPLRVPEDTEMVIEGSIRPGETVVEGPFGNHTGQYVTRPDCPLMRVTAVRCREHPVFPITVVGPPPSENIYLADANEILIREMLKVDFPQVSEMWMPRETFFHGVAVLGLKSQSVAEVRELVYALWQDGPLCRSRLLVLLDEDIDISSAAQNWWRTINRLRSDRVYQDNGRMAIDATGVDPATLVVEDQQTHELLKRRTQEYELPRDNNDDFPANG